MMNSFTKAERICSKLTIDQLFGGGNASMAAYPLRAVYRTMSNPVQPATNDNTSKVSTVPPISILISVPKRRFHRAVDRNRMKRLVREAYRLDKLQLSQQMADAGLHLDIAFICIAETLPTGVQVTQSVQKILRRISEKLVVEEEKSQSLL